MVSFSSCIFPYSSQVSSRYLPTYPSPYRQKTGQNSTFKKHKKQDKTGRTAWQDGGLKKQNYPARNRKVGRLDLNVIFLRVAHAPRKSNWNITDEMKNLLILPDQPADDENQVDGVDSDTDEGDYGMSDLSLSC